MPKRLSDRVKTRSPTEFIGSQGGDRYDFLALDSAEPNLGVPATDNQILSSLADGTRFWTNQTGFAGSQGSTGFTGSQGVVGFTGSRGYTGSQGLIGSQGLTGSVGFSGSIGYTGSQGVGLTIIGSVADVNVDPPNDPQTTLNNAFPGASAGDGVIDAASGDLWVYDGSVWVDSGQIVGFTGSRGFNGSQGFTGSQGFAGSQGVTGFAGSQGVIGYTGSRGFTGSTGVTGFTGSQGTTGFTGSQGIIGYTGSGASGFTGSQGLIGSVGFTGSQGVRGYTGSSSTSSSVNINSDSNTDASRFITYVIGSSGGQQLYIKTDKLTFNPLSGTLTATSLRGLLNADDFPTSGVAADTYGSATQIPVITVDNKGRITSATTSSITVGDGTLTLATSGIATGDQTFTANQGSNATFTVNVPGTNLDATPGTTSGPTITSSTGDDVVIPSASITASGIITTGAQEIAGAKTFRNSGTQDGIKISGRAGGSSSYEVTFIPTTLTDDRVLTLPDATGTVALTSSNITGNATTASTLETARTINGTLFDGSSNITTSTWGTPRDISIGGTSKSVNGSGNVTWATSEIAAQTAVSLTSGNKTINGNLGISESSPSEKLHITGDDARIRVENDTEGNTVWLAGHSDSGGGGFLNLSNDAGTTLVVLRAYGTSYFNAGNVGIGTSSPAAKLDISANNTGATSNNTLRFTDIDGDTQANQQIGKIEFKMSDGSTGGNNIKGYILGAAEDEYGRAYMAFGTGTFGAAAVERMRITSAGNVTVTGDITAFSDIRVKKDIEKISDALSKVTMLNGYKYKRSDDDNNNDHIGVIAQEVINVLPEVVHGGPTKDDPDAYYSVAYGNVVALLIEAIKELNVKIDKLSKD